MKFTIDKSVLFKGINKVQRASDRRSALPCLKGILMETHGEALILTSTDLSLTIQHIIHDFVPQEYGRSLVPAKLFNDLLRKLSGLITIETFDDKLRLSCGELTATINAMDDEEFPTIPAILTLKELCLPTKVLKSALNKTIHCTSPNDTRPIFNGILFKAEENLINFVATDTHRMAVFSYPIDNRVEVNAVIPSKAIKAMINVFDDDVVNMQFDKDFSVFNCGETRVLTRLIEGEFPNYKAVIPSGPIAKFTVGKTILKSSIDRASIFCEKYYQIVRMSGESSLSVSGSSDLFGEVKEIIMVDHEGETVKVAFNSEFLLQAINSTSEERLSFNYFGSNSPLTICEDNYTQLILPVRVD